MKFNGLFKTGAVLFSWLLIGNAALAQETTVQSQPKDRARITKSANPEIYVISAKAGGVSLVSGMVRTTRHATKQTLVLAKSDELNDLDTVTTDANGKAEILLNPGSFLRLAENTDLEFTDTALESIKLKLARGSALVEASSVGNEDGADIVINTPNAVVKLEKSGIYRVNANEFQTEVLVWKGAAMVNSELIKANRKIVTFGKNAVATIAKFDKDDERDQLDIWSKERAKELAQINERLERRTLAGAFRGFGINGLRSGFGGFGSGFWVFNRLSGAYCFVPFGGNYWGSPYGYWHNRGIWWNYNNNPVVINPIVVTPKSPSKFATPDSPTVGFPNGRMPSLPSAAPSMPSKIDPNSKIGRP